VINYVDDSNTTGKRSEIYKQGRKNTGSQYNPQRKSGYAHKK